MSLQNAIELLCSQSKLEKDEGALQFEKLLAVKSFDCDNHVEELIKNLLKLLLDGNNPVEQKHGALAALQGLVNSSATLEKELLYQILECGLKCISNSSEHRICQAAEALLRNLFQRYKTELQKNWRKKIINHIETDLDQLLDHDRYNQNLNFNDGSKVQDELKVWKKFEPSIKVLKYVIEESNGCFLANKQLINLSVKTFELSNHFVREAGFNLISNLLQNINCDADAVANNTILSLGEEFSSYVASGLGDNCAQVRLAASGAARIFLLALGENDRRLFFPLLLPPLCLNRYFAADSVRTYSQESWRQIAGASGKQLVESFIEPTVDFYERCTSSDNSYDREAACACVSELISNISVQVLQPFAGKLLNILLTCLRDVSWPVRDAACLACGKFVINFPEESKQALDELDTALYSNLGDEALAVQQAAATSLASISSIFGDANLVQQFSFLEQSFKNMKNQEKTNAGVSGNNPRIVNGQSSVLLNGCEGAAAICDKSKSQQPWQTANGCICLLGELSNIKEAHEKIVSSLPLLANATNIKHYDDHVLLLETLCKQLPIIVKNVGKQATHNHITLFINDIFYALECENRLTSSAASMCLNQLATLLGQNTLRSKIIECNPAYCAIFESVIFGAPF